MIKAEIVAHSLSPQGDELISVLCTFPRIILAEVNTHRMLSKNTSSSRAIPFNKMVEAIQENPFIPIAWQKDHKGMQGSEYFTEQKDIDANIKMWLHAKDYAIQSAIAANRNFSITKQLCNRLLEPFMWTTMLITGSREGWNNFFELRNPVYEVGHNTFKSKKEVLDYYSDDPNFPELRRYSDLDWLKINKGQAEIHMMTLAECIYDAVNESTPKQLERGEWHIPFEMKIVEILAQVGSGNHSVGEQWTQDKVKISTAMAAHTSYTMIGGEVVKSYEKWIELHDKLISYDPPHSSPMEHCARAMSDLEYYSNIKGKVYTNYEDDGKTIYNAEYYPKVGENQDLFPFKGENPHNGNKYGWCNNLKGFIPYRYLIDNKQKI